MVASYSGTALPATGQTAVPAARSRRTREYTYSTDPVLIAACLVGDEAAWGKLVERYSPLVYTIPRRLGLSQADSDDVLQNVFTIVYRRLAGLKNHACLAAWLITITRHESLRLCRGPAEPVELADELVEADFCLGEAVEQRERQALVHEALRRLDPDSQALLSALFLEYPPPSYCQIARRLGMAVGSIGPARARCLRKLRTVLETLDPELNCLAPTT
jgi:RNA polymerase sigma factor (sigma-70 family)